MHQFNLFPEIFIRDRQALCSSLDVAAHFGKRHKNVLTVIRRQMNDCSPAFRGLNFEPTIQLVPGPKGAARKEPAYNLTRDAFMMVAMSFTGREAARWRELYIVEFNRMETQLAEAARKEAEWEGRLAAARRLAGEDRARLAEQALMLIEEGMSQAGAARLLRVSRHVVYRLRRRFGFLTEAAA